MNKEKKSSQKPSMQSQRTSVQRSQHEKTNDQWHERNCAVHGDKSKFNTLKNLNTSLSLKAPSLIRGSSVRVKNTEPRPSLHKSFGALPSEENPRYETNKTKTLSRGPGQWSFRMSKPKVDQHKETTVQKTNNSNDDTQQRKKGKISQSPFQRSWSLRKPNTASEKTNNAPQRQTNDLISMSDTSSLLKKAFIETPMKKYSSQNDLDSYSKTAKKKNLNARLTPSVSTSSIPSEVSREQDTRPPCVGILKTPGRRKISSNNRVEFLSNVREREIPGRNA